MPLQNRVTPFGEIVAIPERGTMMGNRGILHDARHRIKRAWAGRLWICCLLEFQGRREPVMAPGHYTRLFFLDEPTALAAGHRPCAYCRRDAYNAFRDAWAVGNPALLLRPRPLATEMDRVLNEERIGPFGGKRLHPANLEELPDGVFVTADPGPAPNHDAPVQRQGDYAWVQPTRAGTLGNGIDAHVIWRGVRWRWTPRGYEHVGAVRPGPVLTLTPPSMVAALARGYAPGVPFGLT